jgi:hypothetical protein
MPPPHLLKQRALREYAQRYGLKILVETGTFYGEMVDALRDEFDHIYSIELSTELYEQALQKFKGLRHIELIHGDSGVELGKLVPRIRQPALFWLDGHYCDGVTAKGAKDTPIYEELHHILSPESGHVIIIDDARLFGSDPGYPSVEELSEFIRSRAPGAGIVVQDDSIRVTPPTG